MNYSPRSIRPEDDEASQAAVRGYGRSRIRNAERVGRLGAQYGTFGLAFGGIWMMMWLSFPQTRDVNHWMIWDGIHGRPYELPGLKVAVEQAPQAFNTYFAEEYVKYRERYYYDLFLEDRMRVAYQTGGEEMKDNYEPLIDPKNPDSPVTDLGKAGFIEVFVTGSDIQFNKDTNRYHSKVYYTRRYQKYGAPRAKPEQMMADYTWEKHPANVPEQYRSYSPIGMVVIHYNRQKGGVTQ